MRAHWGLENGLQWGLDVTMNEDQMRNRKDNGPENLALLRRLALNLAALKPSKPAFPRCGRGQVIWGRDLIYSSAE